MDFELDAFIRRELNIDPNGPDHTAAIEYLRSLVAVFDACAWDEPRALWAVKAARCLFDLQAEPLLHHTNKDALKAPGNDLELAAFARFLSARLAVKRGMDVGNGTALGALLDPAFDVLGEVIADYVRRYNEAVERHNVQAALTGGRKLNPITEADVTANHIARELFPFAIIQRDKLICDPPKLETFMYEFFNMTKIGDPNTGNFQMAVCNDTAYQLGPLAVRTACQRLFKIAGLSVNDKVLNDFVSNRVIELRHPFAPATRIAVGNGIVDVGPGFNPDRPPARPTPEHFGALMSPVAYVPDIEARQPDAARRVDDAFRGWSDGDPDLESLLYDALGYCLLPGQRFKASFFVHGQAHCGKTSFLSVVQGMAGPDNCAIMKLGEVTQHFMTVYLMGKTVCIGDESEDLNFDENKQKAAIFKSMTSPGGGMMADIKFMPPVKFDNCAKFIAGCNHLPISSDAAIWERIIILPFRHAFPVGQTSLENGDNLGKDMAADPVILQIVLARAVRHLHAMLERAARGEPPFTRCKASEDAKARHLDRTDPVRDWISSTLYGDDANKAFSFYGNRNYKDTVLYQYGECAKWIKAQPGGQEMKMSQAEFADRVCAALPGQFADAMSRKIFPDMPVELGQGRQYFYFFKPAPAADSARAKARAKAKATSTVTPAPAMPTPETPPETSTEPQTRAPGTAPLCDLQAHALNWDSVISNEDPARAV